VLKSTSESGGLDVKDDRPFLLRNHASRLLKLDPNSLLHGVWLSTKVDGSGRSKKAICGGKVRFPRILSAYIEAKSPQQANWGGVKRERIFDQAESGTTDAEAGFGSIPFPRSDFTAPDIRVFFSFDLQLLRTLALGERGEQRQMGVTTRTPKKRTLGERQGNLTDEEGFLVLWSLYKIERFLSSGLTLRSNCQFTRGALKINEPNSFSWPTPEGLTSELSTLIRDLFPIKEIEPTADEWGQRNVLVVDWSGVPQAPVADMHAPDAGDNTLEDVEEASEQ